MIEEREVQGERAGGKFGEGRVRDCYKNHFECKIKFCYVVASSHPFNALITSPGQAAVPRRYKLRCTIKGIRTGAMRSEMYNHNQTRKSEASKNK